MRGRVLTGPAFFVLDLNILCTSFARKTHHAANVLYSPHTSKKSIIQSRLNVTVDCHRNLTIQLECPVRLLHGRPHTIW